MCQGKPNRPNTRTSVQVHPSRCFTKNGFIQRAPKLWLATHPMRLRDVRLPPWRANVELHLPLTWHIFRGVNGVGPRLLGLHPAQPLAVRSHLLTTLHSCLGPSRVGSHPSSPPYGTSWPVFRSAEHFVGSDGNVTGIASLTRAKLWLPRCPERGCGYVALYFPSAVVLPGSVNCVSKAGAISSCV